MLAKNLLKQLGSVERVITASEDDLKKIDKIGKKKAQDIRRVVSAPYGERN